MHVSIEVTHGPALGQTMAVTPGVPLVIGRGSDAGLRILEDQTISRRHCLITVSPPDCQLTCASPNGTLLNGREVTSAFLFDGDEICLGENSILKVHVTDNLRKSGILPLRKNDAAPISYTEQLCPSGLSRFSVNEEHPDPGEVVHHLALNSPPQAVVDFGRLGLEPPAGLNRDVALFDWLPEVLPLATSPLVVEAVGPEFEALLKQGWEQDAIIVLITELKQPALIEHLRNCLRMDAQGNIAEKPKGLLGICWPGVLEQLLAHRPSEFVERLLAGIDAVLLEAPDSPCRWQLFAHAPFGAVLNELGLIKEAATSTGSKAKK